MSKLSPTKRTLDLLREMGATVQIVERWNPFAKIRQDLFGFIDIVALMDGAIYGIQATSGTNHSKRLQKSMAEPRLKTWIACGGKFQVWSWSKTKPRGGKEVWSHRVDEIRPAMAVALNLEPVL